MADVLELAPKTQQKRKLNSAWLTVETETAFWFLCMYVKSGMKEHGIEGVRESYKDVLGDPAFERLTDPQKSLLHGFVAGLITALEVK